MKLKNLDLAKLRKIETKDLELVWKWRNKDSIREVMYNTDPISIDEHQSWYRRLQCDPTRESYIFEWEKKPVGVVNFTDIQADSLTWGFYIGEEIKGFGLILGYVGLECAFEVFKIKRVKGEVLQRNLRSLNFHQNLGFEQTELLEQVKRGNNLHNIVTLELTKDKWQEHKVFVKNRIIDK